uniref:Uncharacterized protein n=1 Tax=Nelumbo nucifera TaxID=4432 RepID=A0A822YTM0_NELNU|nr:TPA_asm: hypothetical protein HUJ06_011429 [Nelumbo nucifera]
MNGEAVHASPRKTGMIILGGGMPKHHICNANMMRNGWPKNNLVLDQQKSYYNFSFSFVSACLCSVKFPNRIIQIVVSRLMSLSTFIKLFLFRIAYESTWKCSKKCNFDATIAFPLLVAETFAKKANKYTKVGA